MKIERDKERSIVTEFLSLAEVVEDSTIFLISHVKDTKNIKKTNSSGVRKRLERSTGNN